MADLTQETRELLQNLARSVAEHRRAGGALDNLPATERQLLQAMSDGQRQVFMKELADIDAEAGKQRFRERLGKWRPREPETEPDPTGVP
jgi:hypothetical protein